MENKQEVRATGAMPGLELLINFVKGLRFKVVKLSTYNSLKNQLKLKDDIIVNLNNQIVQLIDEAQNDKLKIYSITIEKKSLRKRYENQIEVSDKLQIQINELTELTHRLYKDKSELLEKYNELVKKHSHVNQPRIGGKFASKKQ